MAEGCNTARCENSEGDWILSGCTVYSVYWSCNPYRIVHAIRFFIPCCIVCWSILRGVLLSPKACDELLAWTPVEPERAVHKEIKRWRSDFFKFACHSRELYFLILFVPLLLLFLSPEHLFKMLTSDGYLSLSFPLVLSLVLSQTVVYKWDTLKPQFSLFLAF